MFLELLNESLLKYTCFYFQECGFYVVCGLLFVWIFGECTGTCYRRTTRKEGCMSSLKLFCKWLLCCRCKLLCPPHYRGVYEDLLEAQVNCHLKDELTEIATKRAKAICEPYLQDIGDHEQQLTTYDDNVSNKVSNAWQKISDSGFYLMEHERQHVCTVC